MKIEVSGKAFADAVLAVRDATGKKSPLPAMRRVKVTAADGRVRLTATDGVLLAAADVTDGASVVSDGACLIDPVNAVEFLKACGHEGALAADAKAVEWRGPGGTPRKSEGVIDADQLPGEAEAVPDGGVTLPDGTWRALFDAVTPSLGKWDDGFADRENGHKVKFEVECVLLSVRDGALRVEATDTARLSRAWHRLADGDGCEVPTAMVPAEAVRLLRKLAAGPVRAVWTANRVHFVGEGFRVSSALRAGTFPHTDAFLPTKFAARARVPWADLRRALAVAALAVEKGREKAKVTLAAGKLSFLVRGYTGAGEGEVACEYDGEPAEWHVNAPSVCDLLKAMAGVGDVTVGLSKSRSTFMVEAPAADRFFLVGTVGD